MLLSIFALILAYFMGSICSAIIVCRVFGLPDPRKEGSKNPGATNVLRISGKRYAAVVMGADMLKGMIPVLIAKLLGASLAVQGFTALAAVIGHVYPIFFGFKGGKGVATALGALFGLQIFVGILACITWALVAKISRYASLASIVALLLSPFYTLMFMGRNDASTPLLFMLLLIIYQHRANISRLLDGTESKL